MDIRTEKKASLHMSRKKKNSPGDSDSLFVVEIVLKNRDSRGKNDPVIKDRIKLRLTLLLGVLGVLSQEFSAREHSLWTGANGREGCARTRTALHLESLRFLSSVAPFLSDTTLIGKGDQEERFPLRNCGDTQVA